MGIQIDDGCVGRIHDNAGSGISEIEAIRVGLSMFRV